MWTVTVRFIHHGPRLHCIETPYYAVFAVEQVSRSCFYTV